VIVEPRGDELIWLDGEFLPWRDATMHVLAHHYGFGVFEGVRAYATETGAAIFRLQDHTERLFRSAHIMNIEIPSAYDRERLNQVQVDVLHRNGFRDAYLRPFIFLDGAWGIRPSMRDLRVRVAVLAVQWRAPQRSGSNDSSRGIGLRSSSFVRHPASALLSKAKSNGNYVGSMLALQEAQSGGADDALLLDSNGFVTETTGANLFVVRQRSLFTPPSCSVLEGITRDTVMTLARRMDLQVTERQLTRDEVYVADEVFLSGTASEILPVSRIDGRVIGSGAPGAITERLRALYAAHVRGRNETEQEWLTPLPLQPH
jgi:branched-chain amino acid aminotransferase